MPGQQRAAKAAPKRQRKNPSQRGDFTGNKKEALQREHEETVASRREELGMIGAAKAQIKDEGIIDLMDGQPKLDGTDELVDAAAREPAPLEQPPVVAPEGTKLGGSETSIDVFEIPPEPPQALHQPGEAYNVTVAKEPTLIRSLYDIEDVTIGQGNTFTFREGYRYKVPRWVAAHLEEKGLCDVLSLTLA